jgi:hypothetical protein
MHDEVTTDQVIWQDTLVGSSAVRMSMLIGIRKSEFAIIGVGP